VDVTEYHNTVCALRYLVHTHPDLSHSVSFVSWYMAEPHEDHQATMKRILRYVAGTLDHGLHYGREDPGDLCLLGYNDSDHGRDVDDSRSTSGILFYLGGRPISWQSQKQKSVALSSYEAEYMASSMMVCQMIWLAGLLTEVLGIQGRPPILKVDNKATIDLIKNPVHHGHSKDIRIRYHFCNIPCV
jgi:hypothetical protein